VGEPDRLFPLEFEPHCHQFRWLNDHLGGWQFGEQDLIPAILDALGAHGLCVEFGAGDGDSLPLTIDRMYARSPRHCILVEINEASREMLKAQYHRASISDRLKWSELVAEGQDIAVAVIDIDGMDSVVMRDMLDSKCRPALIVCEHMDRHYSIATTAPNPIPEWLLGMKFESGHTIQDTAETLHWMAGKYGYDRIGLNRCNSFFVRRDLFPLLFR